MNKKEVATLFTALFALSIFTVIPTISSKNVKTIRIGVISSTTEGLETLEPFFKKIIEKDINKYMNKLTKPPGPPLKFEFLIEDAQGTWEIHLEKVEEFHAMGVDLIIGGGWSSQAYYSLDYVNANDMLLLSASSAAPILAIPGDNLFRLCPDDTIQGSLLARMISSREIENVIVIQRDDTWANGLYDVFQVNYEDIYEGTILDCLVYPTEEEDFHSYLEDADDAASQAEEGEDVTVLIFSFSEIRQIMIQASERDEDDNLLYPHIYGEGPDPRDPPWFGTESSGRSQTTLEEAPDQACHLKILSGLSAPPDSPKFNEMAERYLKRTGYEMGYYSATQADAAWIIAHAVVETQSSTGTDVINVLPDIASEYYGYSGWCELNEAGDRESSNFDIWGFYRTTDGTPSFKIYGIYDAEIDEIIWYDI